MIYSVMNTINDDIKYRYYFKNKNKIVIRKIIINENLQRAYL